MDEISRMEKILRGDPIEPITRLEKFCAKAAGTYTGDPLTPASRLEYFLSQISGGGGITLSSFIYPVSGYTGLSHYSDTVLQEHEAPEDVAYNKLFLSDEFMSNMCETYNAPVKHLYVDMLTSRASFLSGRSFETLYVKDVNAPGNISTSMFATSPNFNTLIIAKNSVVPLQGTSAFANTPFASGGTGGTLWVPSALKSSYLIATNWSTILGYANNQIKAIEGSIYE